MKTILTFFCACLLFTAYGRNTTFQKLAAVNACWNDQPDVRKNALPSWQERSETEWIRLHLSLVEQTLRQRATHHLSAAQRQNRLRSLDDLHRYWLAGRFPLNNHYTCRTPIFIDDQDNFCAVGYLVKASGHESVSRMIAARTNLAYVRQMHYPELDSWAKEYGFTREELAWIQPGYMPTQYVAKPMGSGVNGEVRELLTDGDTLYVGGIFTTIGNATPANNIAFVTETGGSYTWHTMATGVNGPVKAITKYNGRIYIGGAFTMAGDSVVNNIAYWENGRWHNAGCLFGEVNDLVVYNNQLYAGGHFDVCAAMADINFARFNGQLWQPVPGLSGKVNTMEVMGADLLLGGAFSYNGNPTNAIKWREANGFTTFARSTGNEINDFELYNGTMYAAGQYVPGGDSSHVIWKIGSNGLDTFYNHISTGGMSGWSRNPVLKTLFGDGPSLMAGGDFSYYSMLGGENCISFSSQHISGLGDWFVVDSTIHKLAYFKNSIVAGGTFKTNYGTTLNGIGRRTYALGVSPVNPAGDLTIYPLPITNSRSFFIENSFNGSRYTLQDMSGRNIHTGALQAAGRQEVILPAVAPGMYLIRVANENGAAQVRKLTIQ